MGDEPSRDVILKPYSIVRLRSLTLRGVEGHPSRGVRSGGSSRVVVRLGFRRDAMHSRSWIELTGEYKQIEFEIARLVRRRRVGRRLGRKSPLSARVPNDWKPNGLQVSEVLIRCYCNSDFAYCDRRDLL